MPTSFYPIGTPGVPWGEAEKAEWLASISIQRSYQDEVVDKLTKLNKNDFDLVTYGSLHYQDKTYTLYALKSKPWDDDKLNVLVTGGVHGYETSGVQGAIQFAATTARHYFKHFNFIIAPCISPWSYEVINRWNPEAKDPNRSFSPENAISETSFFMRLLQSLDKEFIMHIDLHETTDTDETEFSRARNARDGKDHQRGEIPDGFYVVADTANLQLEFQKAIIDSVRQVTHIAPPDSRGEIIETPILDDGIIAYPKKTLGLCAAVTNAKYRSTTEVYPDSDRVTDADCNDAQVAAVAGGLDLIILKEDLE